MGRAIPLVFDPRWTLCARAPSLHGVESWPRGAVEQLAHYRCSSYREIGLGLSDPLLTLHPEYLALGVEDDSRRAAYRALFKSASDDDEFTGGIRAATNGNYVCGEARFQTEIAEMLKQRVSRKSAGRPRVATTSHERG
jgi:putative transposase